MLEDAERTTIGSYSVSGIAMAWYRPYKNYVEHANCCHVTIDAFCQRNSEHNQRPCRMSGIPIVNVQGRLVW